MSYNTSDIEIKNLLEIYNSRIDLKEVFPEVEFNNFQALINWAAKICKQSFSDEVFEKLKKYSQWYQEHEKENSIKDRIKNIPQLETLFEIYHRRDDLMSVIHENNFQELINWAAGIVDKRWEDKEFTKLEKFNTWYLTHERHENDSFNLLAEVTDILSKTQLPMKHTLQHITKGSDISDHLTTLYFLTVENNLRRTLELGVREGESTVTLAEGVSKIGGHLWSMDILECSLAKTRISEYGLENWWTFLQGDDKMLAASWKQRIDHLFIDTSHTFEDTLKELILFEKFLVPGGYITLHDTQTPEVLKAIARFLDQSESIFRFYNYFNCNGFCILKKMYKKESNM
ncbi:MAG: class I SAM-dependent methyltransferase [Nitrosopumilus sp.]|nr:class I SAM-dependent methyltransferase [Nitrosopumilus sp.]